MTAEPTSVPLLRRNTVWSRATLKAFVVPPVPGSIVACGAGARSARFRPQVVVSRSSDIMLPWQLGAHMVACAAQTVASDDGASQQCSAQSRRCSLSKPTVVPTLQQLGLTVNGGAPRDTPHGAAVQKLVSEQRLLNKHRTVGRRTRRERARERARERETKKKKAATRRTPTKTRA